MKEGFFNGPLNGTFGPMTYAAVILFQRKHGLEAVGMIGPKTRGVLNICGTTILPTPSATSTGTVLGTSTMRFVRVLGLGSRGDDVTELQNRLTAAGLYSGPISGVFGPMTKAAVIKLQAQNGLPQTGFVGVLTMKVLNNEQ
jgi:peptidoglycan hydrolase-like protein with peptidoglycan-binding domain